MLNLIFIIVFNLSKGKFPTLENYAFPTPDIIFILSFRFETYTVEIVCFLPIDFTT